jgi:hypothetical protein
MKKLIGIVVVLAIIAIAIVTWYLWPLRLQLAVPKTELRAYMKDEDADLPSKPFVALTVNDSEEPVLVANAPVLFTVGVTNPSANQRAASLESLSDKIKSLTAMQQTPGTAKRLKLALDDYQKKLNAPPLTIGDSTHAWNDALQILVHSESTNAPLPFTVRGIDSAIAKPMTVGAANALEATYGVAESPLTPGSYTFTACLSSTGSWQGKSCSEPVQVTVVADIAQLTPEQQDGFTRHTARYALLAHDWNKLEQIAKKIAATDPASGHIFLGDARFGQKKWREALAEYTAARSMINRQNPDLPELPRNLNERITQVIRKMQDQD